MGFIDVIKEKAKADKKTIVLPETEDKRTYEAAEAAVSYTHLITEYGSIENAYAHVTELKPPRASKRCV